MVDLVLWLLVQHVLSPVHFEGFELRQELLFLLIATFFNFQIYLSLKGGGGSGERQKRGVGRSRR